LLQGHKDLAALRVEELRCASSILGIGDVEFLGYRDSGMAGSSDNQHPNALVRAELESVARRVAGIIRRVRSQVVVTFDPIGGYGHPDHIVAHQATTRAFQLAGDRTCELDGLPPYSPQKLYYQTFPRGFVRGMLRLAPLIGIDPSRFGRNHDIDLRKVFEVDFPIHARIDVGPVYDVKARAAACHASQTGPQYSGLIGSVFRVLAAREDYMRAFPPADREVRETDLFSGVVSDP
jgi:LmbE family N-acetylglucosaminyl deacetylase